MPLVIRKKAATPAAPIAEGGLKSSDPVPEIKTPEYQIVQPIKCQHCERAYLRPCDVETRKKCWNWLHLQAKRGKNPEPGTKAFADWRTKRGE